MKKTSQRSLLFQQNVGRTEEDRAHFLVDNTAGVDERGRSEGSEGFGG